MVKTSVSEGQRYVDKRGAANYISCHPRYLERAVSSGKLKALKPTGKFVRFRLADLDAFMESGTAAEGRAN